MNNIFKRKGSFCIKRTWLEDDCTDFIIALLQGCIIVKAEFDYMTDSVIYHGYNREFVEVEDGAMCPEYEAIYDMESSGLGKDEEPHYIPVFKGWKNANDYRS